MAYPITQFTATAIITADSVGTGRIWDKITSGGDDGILLDLYPNNHLRAIASPGRVVTSPAPIPLNNPTYVAATFDGKTLTLYINGLAVGSTASDSPLAQNSNPLSFGVTPNKLYPFNGKLKHGQFYYTCFTANQVKSDYEASLPRAYSITQFTATAIITATSVGTGRIWDKITSGGDDGILLDLYPDNHLRAIASPGRVVTSPSPVPLNTPTYVAATFDGETLTLYINGLAVGSKASASPLAQNSNPLSFGVTPVKLYPFNGKLKHGQFHYTSFTANQVKSDYEASLPL